MGFSKKSNYYLVRIENHPFISQDPPGPGVPLLGSCEAFDELSAYKILIGNIPDLDAGIRDLVILLNELPGVRTHGSCEGHDEEYGFAYVSLSFENLTVLGQFADLVQFVTSDVWEDDPHGEPPLLDLSLHLALYSRFGEGLPIACELTLEKWAEPGKSPGAAALTEFTAELRRRSVAMFPDIVSEKPVI